MTLDWLHIAALLGAIQGMFLAVVLATQRRNRTANRLLAAAMLAFSLGLITNVYHAAGLVPVIPHFFGVGYPLLLLYGPLVFLYAVTASDRARRLKWWDGLHFLPFVVVVLAALPIYTLSGPEKVAFFQELERGAAPTLIRVVDPLKFVSGLGYAAATIMFLRRHRARVMDSYSSIERVNLVWLLRLAGAGAGIWVLATVLLLIKEVNHPLVARADDIIALAIAALVYAIGYRAFRQPEIFHFPTAEFEIPIQARPAGVLGSVPAPPALPVESAPTAPPAVVEPASLGEATPRYERSGLTEREAAALKKALLAVMENERLYQNSDLTLADLAERLGTTPHKLSEVLNSQLGQTFYDFVNAYRVQEVQRRIAAGEAQRLKMLTLALDAGFASKSTFNVVFKKFTSQTPSDYRRTAGA